jgi:hypothetical protein
MQPIKVPKISSDRLIKTIADYIPDLIATSLIGSAEYARIGTEMVIILSRQDPDRISIKLREEKIINSYDLTGFRSNSKNRSTSAYEADRLEAFANNALTKIDREVVAPLLTAFYSPQKMTTIDAMVRFRSGVVSSITLKTEVNGY